MAEQEGYFLSEHLLLGQVGDLGRSAVVGRVPMKVGRPVDVLGSQS